MCLVSLFMHSCVLAYNACIVFGMTSTHLFIHLNYAPLRVPVHSTKHRHQSPEWAILSTLIASFREKNDSRSSWIVFIHVVREHPGGLLQFSRGELFSPGIHSCAVWPNRESRCAWQWPARKVSLLVLDKRGNKDGRGEDWLMKWNLFAGDRQWWKNAVYTVISDP